MPGGTPLLRFAEAAIEREPDALARARAAVAAELGSEALVDAAAVIGNFQRMVRIADGTGIPLDPPMAAVTADIREDLGINRFASARDGAESSRAGRWFARAVRPLALRGLAMMGRRARRA